MDNTAIEPSEPAMTALMSLIVRHGGSLRVGPLLSLSGLAPGELRLLLSSLAERRRIAIAWRRRTRDSLPEGLRLVDRVTITRWGRSRIPRQPRRPAIHPALLPRSSGRRRTMR
jgi:hypothetical protein